MLISNNIETKSNKKISVRIYGNIDSKYIYILNHGMVSQKESFHPLEKIGGDKYLFLSFDARGNVGSNLAPSRYAGKYIKDIKDIVLWVKENYPKKKIVILGSSWGAANAMIFGKKYGKLVHRIIGWSIPNKIHGGENEMENNTNNFDKMGTSAFKAFFLFLIMILTNINTSIKVVINYKKTTDNNMLSRIGRMKNYDVVSTKYIWSIWFAINKAFKSIKWINKHGNKKVLYIQSELDWFSTAKKVKFLKKNTGQNINFLYIKEFFHACHWEKINNINIRMFKTITNWVEGGKLEFLPNKKIATHTKKELDFSFIISTYNNSANDINRCIQSILQNDSNNYEIVLIDDGTTNKISKLTISKYKMNKKINVITHLKNSGIPFGRNTGIKNAKGEWFVFVDSDDYISPNFIKNVAVHLNDYHTFYILRRDKDKMAAKVDDSIQKYKNDVCVTSRIINNLVFKNYNFPIKYHYALEDWDFHVHLWETLKIKNIMKAKNIYYYYTYNSGSLTKSSNIYKTRLLHAIDIYSEKKTRDIAIKYKLYEHYYLHLLIMAKVWFPKEIKNVQKIKYKQKLPFKIWIEYFVCIIPGMKSFIRKKRNINNE